MKELLLLIFVLFSFQVSILSQSCMPGGIVFSNQADVDNFQASLNGCTAIGGDITIIGDSITNLNGLSVLTSIGGNLQVGNNDGGNAALTSLAGLENVTSLGGGLTLSYNESLTSLTGLEGLTSIGGSLMIRANISLINLEKLVNLTFIGGDLDITGNTTLTGLTGLGALTSIGGGLQIVGNGNLISLTGLEGLTSIPGYLDIESNGNLTSLTGLDNLTYIGGGGLYISDNEVLTGLAPLENLNIIMGNLGITGNDALTNLTGLENVNFNSITNLNISDNSSLYICKSKSLCNYLVNPAGDIVISGNATGCNSEEEVEAACVLSVESIVPGRQYSLFPNPAGKTVNISSGNGVNIDEIVIYNQTGQKVLHGKPVNDIFDISQLSHGMYIIEVVSGKWKEREKLIVQ